MSSSITLSKEKKIKKGKEESKQKKTYKDKIKGMLEKMPETSQDKAIEESEKDLDLDNDCSGD